MDDLRTKFASPVTLDTTEDSGTVSGWLSVPVVDHSREFIDGRDMDLTDFASNPVVLWCHNKTQPPIGKMPTLAPRAYGNGFYGLYGSYFFDPTDDFAQTVYRKMKSGILRGFSVGFVAHGWRPMTSEELAQAGAEPGMRARRMTSGKLLEASIVVIPDNQRALSDIVKTFGNRISDDWLKVMEKVTPEPVTFAADLTKVCRFPTGDAQCTQADSQESKAMADSTQTDTPETVEKSAGKAGYRAVNSLLGGITKAYGEAMSAAEESDDDKLPKKMKGWCKSLGKTCRKIADYGSKKYPDVEDFKAYEETIKAMDAEDISEDDDEETEGDDKPKEEPQMDEKKAISDLTEAVVKLIDTVADVKSSQDQFAERIKGIEECIETSAEATKSVIDEVASIKARTRR